MDKNRMAAFSDGVIAIIITITVLEMRVPQGADLRALWPLLPTLLCYVLSFTFVGIYWNNHHHLLHAIKRVNGAVLWHNLHLLFWLSLVPLVTGWTGRSLFAPWPVACYGIVLLMAGIAYFFLSHSLVRLHGRESALAHAIGGDPKGIVSVLIYAAAIPLAFASPLASFGLYVVVAVIWFVPDRRIEKTVTAS